MLYQRPSFTLPTSNRQMSDIAWDIAMGTRCAKCEELTEDCRCKGTDASTK